MPLMTNAEAFHYDFGIYATELWAMTEAQFLEWLNSPCDRERPKDAIVRCKDCKWFEHGTTCIRFGIRMSRAHDDFCSYGKEKDNGENWLD